MKGSPSIAVMLGAKPDEGEESGGESGLAETKASALDASKALMHAVAARDPEGVYRAFRSLSTLCSKIDDLEDSGEAEEESEGKDDDKGGLKEDAAGSDEE